MNRFLINATLAIAMLTSCSEKEQLMPEIKTVTGDGAWCWFSDPRAIYTHGEKAGIVTGWVKADGSIESGFINSEGAVITQVLAPQLEIDDHANPSFVEIEDGETMVFYTKHFDNFVRFHKMDRRCNFGSLVKHDPFDEEELKKFPLKRTTYANPFYLKSENKIFCFGRWTGFKPNVMVSNDGGKTFSKSKVVITNYPFDGENRPYVKYFSNGESKIHIVFTDGHPRNEAENSVYYAYYEKGNFYKADGSLICTWDNLPFEPKNATLVYKADNVSGKSWVFDIVSDKNDLPIIAYTKYPDDQNHMYWYARFDGNDWKHSKICNSGKWFPQTPEGEWEKEPNYSGGMIIHPLKPHVIYTSEQVNGIFEIVRYDLDKEGKIKERKAITKNSKFDNVRPFFPRNMRKGDDPLLLWMKIKKYIHYTNYQTSILSTDDL